MTQSRYLHYRVKVRMAFYLKTLERLAYIAGDDKRKQCSPVTTLQYCGPQDLTYVAKFKS